MKKGKIFISAIAAVAMLSACSGSNNTENNAASDDTNSTEAVAEADVAEPTNWMPDSAKVLPSGLGIVIEKPGDANHPTPQSTVTVHYSGHLTDGTVFDSSYDRGMPAQFPVGGVIPGFAEGLQQIGAGGKATLYIPSNLGYGPNGAPPVIGPNQNLIFDIEIIAID